LRTDLDGQDCSIIALGSLGAIFSDGVHHSPNQLGSRVVTMDCNEFEHAIPAEAFTTGSLRLFDAVG
jgi:hypothetical protein